MQTYGPVARLRMHIEEVIEALGALEREASVIDPEGCALDDLDTEKALCTAATDIQYAYLGIERVVQEWARLRADMRGVRRRLDELAKRREAQ